MPIVKIHGSANWFWVDDSCVGRTPVTASDIRMDRLEGDFRTAVLDGKKARRFAPTIIPPMLGKATMTNVIARQWREAINLLAGARKLWIIGYSFPPTDAFMPRLLAEGMQENQDIEEIIIINREEQARWRDRVDWLFTPTLRQKV